MADGYGKKKDDQPMMELPSWAKPGCSVYLKGDFRQHTVRDLAQQLRDHERGGLIFIVNLESGARIDVRDLERP